MAIDFGAILDRTIGAYENISVARVERDTAKYNNSAVDQLKALHNSEALNMTEAYKTGNAVNPAAAGQAVNYWDQIPKPLLYGSLGLLGVGLLIKAVK